MKDISYRVALGGIVSALCLLTMFLAGIMPALYLLLPMIAGVLMMIIAAEVNTKWAFLPYAAVSLLSMFITFDKEAALIFILLFGHYPILRFYIQKIRSKFIKNAVKFIICNVCVLSYFFVTVYVFGIAEMLDELGNFGKYGGIIMLALANIIFFLYDINLEICYNIYLKKIMPKFIRKR